MKMVYRYIFLALTTLFSFPLFSQDLLKNGIGNTLGTGRIYFYWDYLRNISPGWIREFRGTEAHPWESFDQWINEKDANGWFTYLDYRVAGTNNWVDKGSKYWYVYTFDSANRLVEMQATVKHLQTNSFTYTTYYEYNAGGNLTRAATADGGGIYSYRIYTYDNNGLNISDSGYFLIQGSFVPVALDHHEYDTNKKRVKTTSLSNVDHNSNITGWDTMEVNYYTWQDSLLSGLESHAPRYRGGHVYPTGRMEYSYNNGRIALVISNRYDTAAAQFILTGFYRHYYANNRLTAMANGIYNDANIRYNDSIALSYLPNDNLDTGYQYTGLASGWEAYPRYRLLFGNIHTGIAGITPVVNRIHVYPNPVSDYIYVDIELVREGGIALRITDLTGKLVKTINAVNLPAGKTTIKVSALDMAPGVYVVTCGRSNVKIVKE